MRHRRRFLTGLAAAVLTFAALTLTLGPRHYGYWGNRHSGYGHHHRAGCDEQAKDHEEQATPGGTENTY